MKNYIAQYTILLASLLLLILITGCASTGNGAYSNNAAPNPTQTASNSNSAPLVPLIIMLQGHAGEKNSISLQISEINAQYIDTRGSSHWQKVADAKDLANSQPPMPFIASEKEAVSLLATVNIPQRRYQQIALKMQTGKTFFLQEDKKLPLEFDSLIIPTPDWALEISGNNLLTINIDATNTTINQKTAKLSQNALTVTTTLASGSIHLKLAETPKSPITLAVAWGNADKPFSTPVPLDIEGSFTINNLPPGNYRLLLNSNEYQLPDDLEPLQVIDGMTEAGEIKLQEII